MSQLPTGPASLLHNPRHALSPLAESQGLYLAWWLGRLVPEQGDEQEVDEVDEESPLYRKAQAVGKEGGCYSGAGMVASGHHSDW